MNDGYSTFHSFLSNYKGETKNTDDNNDIINPKYQMTSSLTILHIRDSSAHWQIINASLLSSNNQLPCIVKMSWDNREQTMNSDTETRQPRSWRRECVCREIFLIYLTRSSLRSLNKEWKWSGILRIKCLVFPENWQTIW